LLWAGCYPTTLTLSGIPRCVIRFKIALLSISSLNWLSIWRVCNRSPKIVLKRKTWVSARLRRW